MTEDQQSAKTLMNLVIEMSDRLRQLEDKMNTIPLERHNEEHEYIKIEIERKAAQRDFWLDIRKKLATAGILGAMGILFTALGYAATQYVKNIGN